MKNLRTNFEGAGHPLSNPQFHQYFVDFLPDEYDMVVVVHNPVPTSYSIDTLCESFIAIEVGQQMRATKAAISTSTEDPKVVLAKQHGYKGEGYGGGRTWRGVVRTLRAETAANTATAMNNMNAEIIPTLSAITMGGRDISVLIAQVRGKRREAASPIQGMVPRIAAPAVTLHPQG
jgi:hypothetical protein